MLSIAPIRPRVPTGNKKAGNATALPALWDSCEGRWTSTCPMSLTCVSGRSVSLFSTGDYDD